MERRARSWLIAVGMLASAGSGPVAEAVVLTRGPYIQMGHFTNSAIIVWRTDISSDSWVDYGLTPAYGMTASGPSGWQHEVTLTGLLPGTNYYYRVRSAGVNLASGEFASAKPPGRPFRIAMFSDSHSGTFSGARGVGIQMAQLKPDLILAAGDLTDNGTFAELDLNVFSKLWEVLRWAPLYWTPGNHDVANNFAACREAFILPPDEMNYWFEYADAQIVSLNSEGLPGTAWLANALAASAKPWKIVFFHRAARSASGGHGENATIRDQYVPVMEQYGVQLAVAGHNHYYWRSAPINGITHLLPGVSGERGRDLGTMPCYSAAGVAGTVTKSFAIADVEGRQMIIRGIAENGNLLDEAIIDLDCPFQLDGLLDASATQVASRTGGMNLWAAVSGRYLYVATEDAGEGNDNFILLARNQTGTMTNLWSWSKSGRVMAYDAFLGDENDNTYSGWFRANGFAYGNIRAARSATRWCNGNHLEGVIDLLDLYGEAPQTLYLAAAPYGSADGGGLVASAQCPAGNGDGNVDPSEFVAVNSAAITVPFFMDGRRDRPGYEIADNNGMKLWAAVYGNTLYVATWAAGDSGGASDHFIFVNDVNTDPLTGAPWAKAGFVAFDKSRKPYLGDESVNNFVGWFNGGASAKRAAAAVNSGQMEGTIDLLEVFGYVPQTLYIAVAPYATADGGALVAASQVPAGNGNGHIEANEFLAVPVSAIRDDNLDGVLDSLDPTRGFVVQSVVRAAGGMTLTWPSLPGRTYRVSYTDNLGQPFQPLSGNLTAAQGQFSMSYTDTSAAALSRRFYRVEFLGP